jgi:hypothetical protein
MYDTVSQYGQVLSGEVDDWHPPVMVRLWQLLNPLWPGTAPMFVLQVALYGAGFTLIVAALTRIGRWRAGVATTALAISPLLLGWQMVILKDAQMLGAMVAAFGIIAHYRLANRRVPPAATALVVLLLAYATLVRANAAFATIPLIVLLSPQPRSTLARGALGVAAIALVLGASPFINHRLLGASSSGVAKSQALFDLAAIAVAAPGASNPFTPMERQQFVAHHCVKEFFWDPLGDPSACGPLTARVNAQAETDLYIELARAAAAHPLAYAEHRVGHWNSTERWLVEPNLPDAAPPVEAEANDLGLETPASALAASWQNVAAVEAATPLGWPIGWTLVGLFFLPSAWRRRTDTAGGLSVALLVSALTLETSFLVISIASDLRYHLWSMTSSALALILLGKDLSLTRRELIACASITALVIFGGLFARSSLPRAPDNYEAMIHAASG